MRGTQNGQSLANFVWSVADLLRGDYKQHEYGQVILPFTLLRRLDCVLEPTKAAVLKDIEKRKGARDPAPALRRRTHRPGQFVRKVRPQAAPVFDLRFEIAPMGGSAG